MNKKCPSCGEFLCMDCGKCFNMKCNNFSCHCFDDVIGFANNINNMEFWDLPWIPPKGFQDIKTQKLSVQDIQEHWDCFKNELPFEGLRDYDILCKKEDIEKRFERTFR